MIDRQAIGADAEEAAARYLENQGMDIVCRNYRHRGGEIDIIARADDVLVFVEVRKRREITQAMDSIDEHKRRKIVRAADRYLAENGGEPACRYDAILVDALGHIEWLQDAFYADE